MQLRKQPVIAAEGFARRKNLTPVLIPKMSKDMDEQLNLAHKLVDIVDRANRKIRVTLLRYNVDKTKALIKSEKMQERRKKRKFNKLSMSNINEEFILSLDVKHSVNENFFTNQHIYNVLQKVFSNF